MDQRTERMLAQRRAAAAAMAAMPRSQRLQTGAATWIRKNWRSAIAVVSVLLALVAGHYLLITLPARARALKVEATREAGRQDAQHRLDGGLRLDNCFAAAKSAYVATWDASCTALKRRASCTLPSDQAQANESLHLHAREDCFKRYSN
jgi:hypothetical protein